MHRVLLLLAVLCLPGCATIATQAEGTNARRGPRVFSGTWLHVTAMASGSHTTTGDSYWVPVFVGFPPYVGWPPLDLPLSFAADILLLPYTIPAQLAWGDLENPTVKFKKSDEKEKR